MYSRPCIHQIHWEFGTDETASTLTIWTYERQKKGLKTKERGLYKALDVGNF